MELFLSFLAVLLFVQLFIRYHNRFSSSRNKRLLQKREPFLGLQQLGFQLTNNTWIEEKSKADISVPAFLGLVDGYAVEISFNWRTGWNTQPHYRIRVFFEPGSRNTITIEAQVAAKLAQSKLFRWQDDRLLTPVYAQSKVFIGKTYRPNAQRLVEAAVELIKELQKLDLEPIEYHVGVDLSSRQKQYSEVD